MLILSRRLDEKVILTLPDGERVTIQVIGFKSGTPLTVRLGFDAPKEIAIHREEVQQDIDEGRAQGHFQGGQS
jgi:carbon storage regulator CsrA